MAICVIGSGPAGVSASYALLQQGATVFMLDAGNKLEKSRADKLENFSRSYPDEWDRKALEILRSNSLNKKLAYGSDFPYRKSKYSIPINQLGVDLSTSLALGGLSNVWGAAAFPYGPSETSDWPITSVDLAPYYKSVLKFMPISAYQDGLQNEYPIFTEDSRQLRPSQQAVSLMRDLNAHHFALERAGIRFGHARLAVRASSASGVGDCTYCGMCLHGCPRRLIYNSASSVEILKTKPRFRYVGDTLVDSISEVNGDVKIYCRSVQNGDHTTISAERVYVAGGVLGTAKILLKSLNAYGQKLYVKDSQYFGFPILRWDGIKDVTREPMHTLAQLFLEIKNPSHASKSAHIQIYTYNDVYREQLKKRLGLLKGLERILGGWLYGRLFFANGYLHSDDSSSISVCLKGDDSKFELLVRSELNPVALRAATGVIQDLNKLRFLRMTPLSSMMIFGEPGKSNHVGGTFPMRREPKSFETDIQGRVTGFKKVHVVDASTFPSVPALPITLSVMANAYRIGSLLSEISHIDR